jgi:dTDP-4-dehydrorhamnose reductase
LVLALERQGATVIGVTRKDLDVRDSAQVFELVENLRPDVVVNTAAFHRVEECERQPAVAFEVNAVSARAVAVACERRECRTVYVSTDYVFDGRLRRPYREDDLPSPLNIYGASKLAGECLVKVACARHLIIRTSGLYGLGGSSGKGGNFVEAMLGRAARGEVIRVVSDQVLTPTYTVDLADAITRLIFGEAPAGVYHVSGEGQCSWYEFTRRILEIAGSSATVLPVSTEELASPVRRPPYSVLDKGKVKELGVQMPPWEESLERYLRVALAGRGERRTEC